jgi:hypothetical protein
MPKAASRAWFGAGAAGASAGGRGCRAPSEALGAQRLAAGTASGLEQIQRQGATLQAGITATQARADCW